ncbi:hypothetical protein [Vibrio parahaemolyticus]
MLNIMVIINAVLLIGILVYSGLESDVEVFGIEEILLLAVGILMLITRR